MSKWIFALTIATVASAGASTYFWQELRTEREQTATLQSRIAQLEHDRETAAAAMPAPEPEPVEEPAAPPAAVTTPAKPAARVATNAVAANGLIAFGGGNVDPKMRERMFQARQDQMRMLQDPEYRELMREQQKHGLRQHYNDLDVLLGLSDEQAEQLLDVLAEQSIRGMEQQPPFMGEQPTEDEMRAYRSKMEDARRKSESEIAAVLGSRYSEWQQYQQSGWARSQVSRLRQTLATGNEPLRQDQIKPLVEAIAREQKQALNTVRPTAPSPRPDAMEQARMAEEWLERTAQSHERIRASVSGLLSPSQYQQLERQQQQELKMQELGVRQQRARAEAQARGELPPDPAIAMQPATTMFAN